MLNYIKTSDTALSRFLYKILLFVFVRILWGQLIHGIYDNYRFFRYSAWNFINTKEKYDSILIKEYHRIEKWLTYNEFRPFFGKKVIENIIEIINKKWPKFWLTWWAEISINTIQFYLDFHEKKWYKDDDFVEKITTDLNEIKTLLNYNSSSKKEEWWMKIVKKEEILENSKIWAKDFFYSRYSIRDFDWTSVDKTLVKEAIEIALKTPSVCNRQSWRTYLLTDKKDILNALKYQNWNWGFNKAIDKLLIVTTELADFHNWTERYQNWIDWGMFSMSIVYALHSLWLWSCCLNWSAYFYNDIRLRKVVPIKKSESIIMMIAVWNIPEKLKVAQSPRKNVDDILTII